MQKNSALTCAQNVTEIAINFQVQKLYAEILRLKEATDGAETT